MSKLHKNKRGPIIGGFCYFFRRVFYSYYGGKSSIYIAGETYDGPMFNISHRQAFLERTPIKCQIHKGWKHSYRNSYNEIYGTFIDIDYAENNGIL